MSRSALYGKPRQLKHASEAIGRGLEDIATGRSSGKYPAIEALLSPKIRDYGHRGEIGYSDTLCTEDCPNRRRGQQEGELILDVRPPAGERLAVVEHRIDELKVSFDDHKTESIRAGALYATKEELDVLDDHVKKLDTQGTFKTVALVFTVIVSLISLAYNAINLYKIFHL